MTEEIIMMQSLNSGHSLTRSAQIDPHINADENIE